MNIVNFPETRLTSAISASKSFQYRLNILTSFSKMYEWIYLVFIRSLCIFVEILTVIRSFIFFYIKYEYNITLNKQNKNIIKRISIGNREKSQEKNKLWRNVSILSLVRQSKQTTYLITSLQNYYILKYTSPGQFWLA